MKYKKYPSYKDSGVEWLGEIPSEWEKIPARAIVSNLMKKNTDNKDDRYLSLMANIGVIRYEDKGDVGNKKPDDLSKCKIVNKGNLIINSMNYSIGSFGMSQYDGICSPVYVVLDINKIVIDSKYALRIFENSGYQKFISSFGNGILAHRAAIGWDEIKGSYMPLPSIHEQQQIANFLDKATAKIDTLIEKQTKQIELLKEKRQAVISHAVTKGINPNVPMKDSGVEWLGEIPEHWEGSKLKFYTNVKGRIGFRGYTKDDLVSKEEGALVIGASEMNNNAKLEIKKPQYISWYKYYESPEIILNQGDLLFVQRGSTVGKVAHIDFDIEEATINPSLVVLKRIKLNPFYLKYYLLSNLIKAIVKVETSNTAIPMISQEQIGNYTLSFPKKEDEQQQIVNYLDEKTSKIDILIEKSNKSIELLKEKRIALISAAVSGKIDVREFE